MSRTVSEIKQVIIDEKNAQPELTALNSPSQTAIWNLWAYIIAVFTWFHERLWDAFKQEVEERIAQSKPGTPQWYHSKFLEYQYGYTLQIDNYQASYAVVDENARIIKRAAIVEQTNGIVLIKVAKENAGAPVPLSVPELTAFAAYIDDIKYAGTITNIISLPSDKLRCYVTVYYNPIKD